jgi:hypothetical protein
VIAAAILDDLDPEDIKPAAAASATPRFPPTIICGESPAWPEVSRKEITPRCWSTAT